MSVVTLSEQFELALPSVVLRSLGLVAGDQFAAFHLEGRLTLVPIKPMQTMRGFLAGIELLIERDGL